MFTTLRSRCSLYKQRVSLSLYGSFMHVVTEFQTRLFSILESEDLDKVTVKSLDEIKREKEERLKQSSGASSLSAANSVATRKISNGGTSEVFGKTFRWWQYFIFCKSVAVTDLGRLTHDHSTVFSFQR